MSSQLRHDSATTEDRRRRFEAIADEIYEPLQRYLSVRRGIRQLTPTSEAPKLHSESSLSLWSLVALAPAASMAYFAA